MRKILPLSLLVLTASFLGGCNMINTMKDPEAAFSVGHPNDYRLRHPIMVSPSRAYVPHRCGQWPDDTGAMNATNHLNNGHWNHACATQQNLAAMVVNPNDLVEARPLGPSDGKRRVAAVTKLQQGQDPSTSWKIDDKNKTTAK